MPVENEELLEVIPETGATSSEICKSIGLWSENSIRKRLLEMVSEGVVTRDKRDIEGGFEWVYRPVQP